MAASRALKNWQRTIPRLAKLLDAFEKAADSDDAEGLFGLRAQVETFTIISKEIRETLFVEPKLRRELMELQADFGDEQIEAVLKAYCKRRGLRSVDLIRRRLLADFQKVLPLSEPQAQALVDRLCPVTVPEHDERVKIERKVKKTMDKQLESVSESVEVLTEALAIYEEPPDSSEECPPDPAGEVPPAPATDTSDDPTDTGR